MSLTDVGFVIKRQETYVTELQAAFRAAFGSDINVNTADPDSIPGQLISIFSERFALVYEMAQALYDSRNRNNAADILLDNLAQILGLTRLAASTTTAVVTLAGDAALVVPAGQKYATVSGIVFTQDEEVTLDGAGSATGVAVTAEEVGAVEVADAAITVISVPLSGLSSVTNPAAAATGTDEEKDAELRDRMVSASSLTGSTTVDAIRSRLLQYGKVTAALVIENTTGATVSSQPTNTIQCVVYPNTVDTSLIATLIWFNKPAGIGTYGTETAVSIVDTQGFSHDVYFSFAAEVYIETTVTLTHDTTYPSDGEAQVQQAIMSYINELDPGEDVQTYKLVCEVSDITGVESLVVTTRVKETGSYDVDNEDITAVQVARVQLVADTTVSATAV